MGLYSSEFRPSGNCIVSTNCPSGSCTVQLYVYALSQLLSTDPLTLTCIVEYSPSGVESLWHLYWGEQSLWHSNWGVQSFWYFYLEYCASGTYTEYSPCGTHTVEYSPSKVQSFWHLYWGEQSRWHSNCGVQSFWYFYLEYCPSGTYTE